jgi:hypothetical protein
VKPGNAGGGKGPWFKATQEAATDRGLEMILTPPESVQKLQLALQTKAKEAPNYRFYLLYDSKRDSEPIDLRASDDCDGVSFCG